MIFHRPHKGRGCSWYSRKSSSWRWEEDLRNHALERERAEEDKGVGESSTEGKQQSMDGLLPMLLLSVFFLTSSSDFLHSITAEDRLALGRPLSINQTIVSAGGVFALGFFSPGSSQSRRYVGIWYNNIPGKTVVWVANRENPLMDAGGVLTIAADGNIVLFDGKGRLLWSSVLSEVYRNASAVLLDTGNLVLRGAQGEDDVLWQSFDHPADTMLPEMKLRLDVRTGAHTLLVSWRAADDPSPGNFSIGFDPETYTQVKTWRGTETWARGPLLNGNEAEAVYTNTTTSIFVRMPKVNSEEISAYFTVRQGSPPMRVVLDNTGVVKSLLWERSSANWSLGESFPSNPCGFYNRCGPSGFCNSSGNSFECSCLRGFVPFDQEGWIRGNFSGGCIKKVPLQCDQGDKFLRLGMIRVPDRFALVRNVDGEKCEAECLRRCNCTAYSYSNRASVGSSSRCLVWAGELRDLRAENGDNKLAYELNVRLVASELGDSSKTRGPMKKKNMTLLVITFATVGAVMFSLGVLGLFVKRISKGKGKGKKKDAMRFRDMKILTTLPNEEQVADPPWLHFSGVLAATESFSPANKLGEGGFGPVYKGTLPDGDVVAVKRLSKCSGQGLLEFRNEVELISRLQHKNIVQLLGWCVHEDEKILIYEYLPNRSLDKFIFDPLRVIELDWEKRFHIIKGIAQGLLYLHQHSRLHVVHRDLKTSNILLDDAMNAKISDFGLARMFRGSQEEANTNRIVGTYGYMSPEYALDGHFSEKSDVFSFGVILLEIISGRRNTGFYPYKESLNLLGHAWKLWNEGRGLELLDPSLGDSCPMEIVSRCMHVSLICIQEVAAARPTTSEIVGMLGAEINASLPTPRQPAFFMEHESYGGVPTNGSINFLTISSVESR